MTIVVRDREGDLSAGNAAELTFGGAAGALTESSPGTFVTRLEPRGRVGTATAKVTVLPRASTCRRGRLVEAAGQLETRGEATLAELALRRAIQSPDSGGAPAAMLELSWFLQRQGREAEAALWVRRLGDQAQIPAQLRESAERLQRTLTVEPKDFDRYL